MKVVSEQLGHSSLAITADTYTSVVPAVAQAAAEAVADLVPRSRTAATVTPSFPIRSQSSPKEALLMSTTDGKPQVRKGGPRGDRTHNPRIKSPLLCQLS
jgi:hypothetical protein